MTGRSAAAVAALVAVGSMLAVPAEAVPGPTVVGDLTVPAAADYATEYLANPLDYSDAADLLTDGHATDGWAPVKGTDAPPVLSGGQARWTMTGDGHVFPVWMTFPGALPEATDGWWNPIDADRYRRVAVRMYSSVGGATGALDFWKCNDPFDVELCAGRVTFGIREGWYTYIVDFDRTGTEFAQTWDGEVIGLQLTLNQMAGTDLMLDWVRIYEPSTPVDIVAVGTTGWDRDTDRSNNTPTSPDWGVFLGQFDVGAYPPGTYHIYDETGYGDTITIEPVPVPRITDPDAAGGEDYATRWRGDAWDFAQPTDVVAIGGADSIILADGQLQGTNTTNDPWVRVPLVDTLDADRYHRLTVTTAYDGPFDLADARGGGTHGRIVFKRAALGSAFVDSREMVTFTDRATYTYDLKDPRLRSTEDPATEGNAAAYGPEAVANAAAYIWDGQITQLRWDPNEDRGERRWRIDELRLAADDEAAPTFDIHWHDQAPIPGTTVTIGLDADRRGFDGTVLAQGIPQRSGENVRTVDLTGIKPGRYWVYVTADTGSAVGRTYASGPLVVGDRIAGSTRIDTSVAMSAAAYPDGNDEAILATADSFPDALAGVQLAAAAKAPILLTTSAGLAPAVARELVRLGARSVYVLGGPHTLQPAVEEGLAALGVSVTRLSGPDRVATAVAIARESVRRWDADGGRVVWEVLLASADDYPDALAASQLSAAAGAPLVLVHRDRPVPTTVTQLIGEVSPAAVTAIGGTSSIPEQRLSEAARGRDTRRLAGSDRHATAAVVRAAAIDDGAAAGQILIASGRAFPDALAAAGVLVARNATLLTTDPGALPPATANALADSSVIWYRIAGGPGAVSAAVAAAVAAAA